MANITQTTANNAGYVPSAWATEALDVLRQNIAVLKSVARDTDFEDSGWKGKDLTIPYPGTFAAQGKTAGSLATVQVPSNGSSVKVSLTQHQTVDFILEDVPFSEASAGLKMMQNYGAAAGIALAEKVENDLLAGLQVGSNGGMSGTPLAGMNKNSFFQARKMLNDNKAPKTGRSMVISTADSYNLMTDTTMQNYFAFNGGASNDWAEGIIGRFAAFDIYESQGIAGAASGHVLQSVTISGGVTGGTFTLTYGAQTTAAIAWNATALTVQNALNALSSLGASFALVSGAGGNNGVYYVYFTSAVVTPGAITGSAASLTGGTPAITIADVAAGANQNIAYHHDALIVAFRQLQTPSSAGVDVAYASDPDSGVTLRILMQYQPQYRGLYVAYDVLYGYTNLRPNQAITVMG